MSRRPDEEPACDALASDAIELAIRARPRDLGGFVVRRVLPSARRRLVGPFIFFDHMGPAEFQPGTGIDVRPHPHVALATVTYLFEGELFHRDSLGSAQAITPGDVNWMVAGRGIVHSERTAPERRRTGQRIAGIQAWVALPTAGEDVEPSFAHHPGDTLPRIQRAGVELRVIAGTAYGARSPVAVSSPTLYVDAQFEAGAVLQVPAEHDERAIYVAAGAIACGEQAVRDGEMLVLRRGVEVTLRADSPARVLLIGGAPLDGERHIYWNFVASSPDRIERAKRDWREGRFPSVPGDDQEFIPLPED